MSRNVQTTRRRRVRGLTRRVGRETSGFTLAEVAVAMLLVTGMMMGLTAALGSGLRAARSTKRVQQATALGNSAVEKLRDSSFDSLAMHNDDVSPGADPRIKNNCPGLGSGRFFDPDDDGPLKCEKIASLPSGASINTHVTTETVEGLEFTVSRYVTWVDAATASTANQSQGGPGEHYKRVVAIVEWQSGTIPRSFLASTLVAKATRGVEVAAFELAPAAQGKRVYRGDPTIGGTWVEFGHVIHNRGFADRYTLTFADGPEPPGRSWTASFYRDANQNGVYDEFTDPLIGSSGAMTDLVSPDASFPFIVRWRTTTTDAVGVETTGVTVTSEADPELSRETENSVDVVDQPMPLTLYLHNRPSPPTGNTVAQTALAMDGVVPTAPILYAYSTDIENRPGRVLERSNQGKDEDRKDRMVNWYAQVTSHTVFKGTATLRTYLVNADVSCFLGGVFDVHLFDSQTTQASGTHVVSVSSNTAPLSCPSRDVSIGLSNGHRVMSGRFVELKLTTPQNNNNNKLSFGYDSSSFVSVLTLPRVSVVL